MRLRIPQCMALLVLCLLVAGAPARAADTDAVYHFRSGIHLSREHTLNEKELQLLLTALRALTGYKNLATDTQNDLVVANRAAIAGGSTVARELLTAALDGRESLTIESADHSSTIAFAQLDSPLRYSDGSGKTFEDWRIKIDFSDFKELRGDEAAMASFDPGMAFMHELVHAILGYADPLDATDQLGDCERYLNRVRAELRLPERQHYYPVKRFTNSPGSLSQIYQGTLTFVRNDQDTQKQQQMLVTFDLNRVFDISKARSRNAIQSELLARHIVR